ncbi:MAG: hypothetical protein IT350_07255 [Deltaproteobacteria bacterium]|nr:hypothetical protein [Deltaproteobacteria bacterium]
MRGVLRLGFVVVFMASVGLATSCAGDDDEDSVDEHHGVDTGVDDDADDDLDDDSSAGSGPVLSGGDWNPVEDNGFSFLYWFVCDPDGDLDDGSVVVRSSESGDVIDELPWTAWPLAGEDDLTDCENPVGIGVEYHTATRPAGPFCVDVQATDAAGHPSNVLSDICVEIPEGSAPVLSTAFWDPAIIGAGGSSTLVFDLCDEDDNLFGGQVFIWWTGTDVSALDGELFYDDFPGDHTTPCESLGIIVDFVGFLPDTYGVDLQISDGHGNLSNKLTNISIELFG